MRTNCATNELKHTIEEKEIVQFHFGEKNQSQVGETLSINFIGGTIKQYK